MEFDSAVATGCFQALAHPTRLEAFRRLVQRGAGGATPGTLREWLGVPAQTLSFHLKELASAELVMSRREGRSIRYVAGFDTIRALAAYLMEDCCGSAFSSPPTPPRSPTTARRKRGRR